MRRNEEIMPQPTKLQISNRTVLSSKLNYDDLIILYEQFITTYGRTPSQRYCLSKYNMPTLDMVYRVLDSNNITYADFVKRFDDKTPKSLNVNIQTQKNKEKFPITINKTTYDISGDVEIIHKDSNHNSYYLDLVDNLGYKYNYSYNAVMAAYKNQKELNRFFKRNKYTYDNINLYCKLNNIDLKIDGAGLLVSGYARELLNFTDGDGNIIKTSWNHISSSKIKFRNETERIKIKNKTSLTKEQASSIIIKKQEDLGRPLLQSDFEGIVTSKTSVGVRIIWKYWGNFNNMIKDLGLLSHDCYFKPNSENYIPHEKIMKSIKTVCETVKRDGRDTVMYKDFNLDKLCVEKVRKHCRLDGTTLNKEVKRYGCKLQRSGNGMNHRFEDGEKVVSKYEYDFSTFLRNNGFIHNVSYFRDVKYKDLDNSYKGQMNCDYKIIINNQIIYIELAGILSNQQHIEAYLSNTPIVSKSKEKYRQSLNKKKSILEKNRLEYYILLPQDMNEENYRRIINKYLEEVA